jgi:hypothetical protein
MMATAKKIPSDRIAKHIEKLEDQVFLKKIKRKDMYKSMVSFATELVCADQPRRSYPSFS